MPDLTMDEADRCPSGHHMVTGTCEDGWCKCRCARCVKQRAANKLPGKKRNDKEDTHGECL